MSLKTNTGIKKYLKEGLLIVFSVLFALFINKAFENHQIQQKKSIARESMLKELRRNEAILNNWKGKHLEIRQRIASILEGENDSLRNELQQYDFLNLGVLTNNQSLIDAILTQTAWETAKTTGIITEFDYESIQRLTQVYTMQEVLTDRTVAKILDYYFATESHDLNNLDKTLVQLQLRFWELTGQEELMTELYSKAIEQLEK